MNEQGELSVKSSETVQDFFQADVGNLEKGRF